jgi:predicted SprT family Zn-dependent metalloprotease
MYQTQEDKVLAKAAEVFQRAEKIFEVNLKDVIVQLSFLGSAAGQAGAIGTLDIGYLYYIRLNKDMLHRKAFGHLHDEAIPHEIAHIICFMRPDLGRRHNKGWVNVCKELGGTAAVLHDEKIVYGKGLTYEYYTTTGCTVRVSQTVHQRVEAGENYTFRRGQGIIDSSCAHSIVGASGKTLPHPIVRRAVQQPELELLAA